MNESAILELTTQALVLVLILSMPPIIVASVTGVLVSLVQALTQVQEQTLSFAVKLISVAVTLVLTASWVSSEVLLYTRGIFDLVGKIIR